MKKLIALTLILGSTLSFAQVKPKTDTTKTKTPYVKFVKVSDIQTFNQLVQIAQQYKSAIPYIPGMSNDQKITLQQNLDGFLLNLNKSVSVDSVKQIKK